jgi:hypothetical protein
MQHAMCCLQVSQEKDARDRVLSETYRFALADSVEEDDRGAVRGKTHPVTAVVVVTDSALFGHFEEGKVYTCTWTVAG